MNGVAARIEMINERAIFLVSFNSMAFLMYLGMINKLNNDIQTDTKNTYMIGKSISSVVVTKNAAPAKIGADSKT